MSVRQARYWIIGLALVILFYRLAEVVNLGSSANVNLDPTSETVTLHSAMSYYVEGFAKDYGLMNIAYDVDEFGRSKGFSDIYKHYPAGAELLTGATHYICGGQNVICLRLFPLSFNWLLMVIFMLFLTELLTPIQALVVSGVLLLTPMFTNNLSALAFHGYAMALSLMQFMYLVRWAKGESSYKLTMFTIGVIAFLIGSLCLDYFFVTVLMPLVVTFWLRKIDLKWGASLTVLAFVAYGLAFALHFLQVIGYYGDWRLAIQDFVDSAKYRTAGIGNTVEWIKTENLGRWNVVRRQMDVYFSKPQNFGFPAQILIVLVALLLGAPKSIRVNANWQWRPNRHAMRVLIAAYAMGLCWTLVMRHHAYVHFWIARHYLMAYILTWVFLCSGFERRAISQA